MSFEYPIQVQHIFISEGHNFFKNPKGRPGSHVTRDVASVEAVAGQGLVGDRFFGYKDNFNGQVTFFSAEVHEALLAELQPAETSPVNYRRNLVIAGVHLISLIGKKFAINGVEFEGAEHCTPCNWMDTAYGAGAHKFLRGRGGLRARILSTGVISKGDGLLTTYQELDNSDKLAPLVRAKLPG